MKMQIVTDGPRMLLHGDFDARSTEQVRAAVYEMLETQDELVIDLTHVDAVDLTALRVLAVATRLAARRGRRVRLRGCNGAVRRLLHASRLIRVVEIERPVALSA